MREENYPKLVVCFEIGISVYLNNVKLSRGNWNYTKTYKQDEAIQINSKFTLESFCADLDTGEQSHNSQRSSN